MGYLNMSYLKLVFCLSFLLSINSGFACVNTNFLGSRLIESICWDCFLPLKIMGAKTSTGVVPAQSNSQALCNCTSNPLAQGFSLGIWQASRIIELVREPGCMLAFNGQEFPVNNELQMGNKGNLQINSVNNAFYHYHYYAFPLLSLLDLLSGSCAQADDYLDIDLLYLSEFDPTWDNPELAHVFYPESRLFTSVTSTMACAADNVLHLGLASSDKLAWCAGTWGNIYPLTGHVPAVGSLASQTSLLASRVIASLQRKGLIKASVGAKALCNAQPEFVFHKSHYRMSMLYPVPETKSNHAIGQSSFSWGENANFPQTGEDAMYLLWQWRDCCNY